MRHGTPRRLSAASAAALALALAATACGGDSDDAGGSGGTSGDDGLSGQSITVAGVWTGTEQENMQKVLDAFTDATGVTTTFVPTGDSLATFIGSKIQGGAPPDVVLVPQVGVLQEFADNGWLTPLDGEVRTTAEENFAPVWRDYGTVDGTFYGLYFKAAHKSTVWYNPDSFDLAGVQPPATFAELLTTAGTLVDSGTPAFAVAGADGWTLTDWFENIYLSQAGPEKYDQLAAHEIPWTDESVVTALTTLGEVFSDQDLLAGGTDGALNTDFPGSVAQVFGTDQEAAMVYEGDFVGGIARGDHGRTLGEDADFFPFPPVDGGPAPVVSGGDAAAVLKDGDNQEAAMALMEFLATPEAAAVWAAEGGFLSPNQNLDLGAYGDDTTRETAASLIDAGDSVRFDMSDQAPAAFGGTAGAGEWKVLQDFLADTSDPAGTAAELEAEAAKAFGN